MPRDQAHAEIELAAARWRLDRLPADEIQRLAVRLLESGYSSPALDSLAGTPAFALGTDLRELVDQVFRDVEHPMPTASGAALRLARQVAADIVMGRVAPYEGARQIWTVSHEADESDFPKLAIFVGLASEIEDHPDMLSQYEPRIMEEAERLLHDA